MENYTACEKRKLMQKFRQKSSFLAELVTILKHMEGQEREQ
jgi:hypothetical protein